MDKIKREQRSSAQIETQEFDMSKLLKIIQKK